MEGLTVTCTDGFAGAGGGVVTGACAVGAARGATIGARSAGGVIGPGGRNVGFGAAGRAGAEVACVFATPPASGAGVTCVFATTPATGAAAAAGLTTGGAVNGTLGIPGAPTCATTFGTTAV